MMDQDDARSSISRSSSPFRISTSVAVTAESNLMTSVSNHQQLGQDNESSIIDQDGSRLDDRGREHGNGISGNQKDEGQWVSIWDANAQAYYYWNRKSGAVTWEKPAVTSQAIETQCEKDVNGAKGDYADYWKQYYQYYPSASGSTTPTLTKSTSPAANPTSSSTTPSIDYSSYYSSYDSNSSIASASSLSSEPFTLNAQFNSKTGKFQALNLSVDPTTGQVDHFSAQAKAARQMNYFFDYNSYLEQMNKTKGGVMKKKKLTKKDIEKFKAKKEEKKRRGLLNRLGE